MQNKVQNFQKDLDQISVMLKQQALLASRFDDALICSQLLGRLHFENISDSFCDDEFEEDIYKKWQTNLVDVWQKLPLSKNKGAWCHIITRTYGFGGHTRLFIELWKGISARQIKQSIIITDKDKGDLREILLNSESNVDVLSGGLARRCSDMFEIACGHDVVVLHIHPNDIGAALVARKLRLGGTKVLFVNHSDHTFSFGTGAADAVLEISATGWKTTQGRRKVLAQHFLGIPLYPNNHTVQNVTRNISGPILSVGNASKFHPMGDLNFAIFLEKLMKLVPNEVILIGPKTTDPWWKPLLNKYPSRLLIMGVQHPKIIKMAYQRAACYIDSFPMDGGTSFSEAIMSGLPCFGLNKSSAPGVSPAEALRCYNMNELIEEVVAYLKHGNYSKPIDIVKENIKKNFSTDVVVERLYQSSLNNGEPLPKYLHDLGTRGVGYFHTEKTDGFKVSIPRKIWWKLSFSSRVRMLIGIKAMDLSANSVKLLRRRIIFGL
jgi:hypothetical protein